MHFVMGSAHETTIEGPALDESWAEGRTLEWPPDAPLVFVFDSRKDGAPLSLYDGLVPLWSDRLLAAVREAGVDNIEAFPAVLRDRSSGREWTPYWAVNVVGLVAAIDREKSGLPMTDRAGGDLDPEAFVLDQKTADRFRIFRLAESPDLVIVDEHVRRAIERQDLADIRFTQPGAGEE